MHNATAAPQEAIRPRSLESERSHSNGAVTRAVATQLQSPRVRLTDGGKQVPVANGGVGPGYWWSQTLADVALYVPLPPTTRAKDVQCNVTVNSVRIGLRGVPPLVEGTLAGSVRQADSLWSLDSEALLVRDAAAAQDGSPMHESAGSDGPQRAGAPLRSAKLLTLTLDKVCATWWASALRGDPEIDGSLIDSTVSMHEYDDETQAAIRKIMFDQSQAAQARSLLTST